MMIKMRYGCLYLAAAMMCLPATAPAAEDSRVLPVKEVELVLHPSAKSLPSPMPHLLPEFIDQIPGNAALYYYQALDHYDPLSED